MADFSGGSAFGSIVQPFLEHVFNTQYQDGAQAFAKKQAEDAFNRERDFAIDMQSRGTSLKMSDLRRAGLSPAFLNGAMLATNPISAHSSAPSLPAQRAPEMRLAEGMLMEAQAKNLSSDSGNKEADTEVKRLEAERKKIENQYLPALKQREVSLMDGSIKLTGSNINYTDEQCKNVAQQTFNLKSEADKINAEIDEIRARIANYEPDTVKRWIDAYFASPQYEAVINNLKSQTKLNYTQADDLIKTRVSRIFGLNASALKDWEEYNGITIQNGSLSIDFELDKEYSETERKIDLWLRPVRAIGEVIGSFAPFVTRKVKTDSNVNSHSTSYVTSNSTSNVTSKSVNHNYNHTPNKGRRFGRKR